MSDWEVRDLRGQHADWADIDGPPPERVPVVRCGTCLQVAPFHWPACPVGAAEPEQAAHVEPPKPSRIERVLDAWRGR